MNQLEVPMNLLPDRPLSLPILAGPLRGELFQANYRQRPHYLLGRYERRMVACLQDRLRRGACAWDIGANVGYLTLVMARLVGRGGSVYAFEPSPHAYAFLARNATRASNVRTFQLALGDRPGIERFSDFDYDLVSRLGDHSGEWTDARVVTVEVSTVDAQVAAGVRLPDLLKIDVEGAELRVLYGMNDTFAEGPDLLIELHGPEMHRAAESLLAEAGYRSQVVTDGSPTQALYVRRP